MASKFLSTFIMNNGKHENELIEAFIFVNIMLSGYYMVHFLLFLRFEVSN